MALMSFREREVAFELPAFVEYLELSGAPDFNDRFVEQLSFPVEGYVDRGVSFASQHGKKSIAALVPENDYGTLAMAQFQQSAATYGIRVPVIERYKPGAPGESKRPTYTPATSGLP